MISDMKEAKGKEHSTIEVTNVNKSLAYFIKDQLYKESPSSSDTCIYRIPESLRQHNKKAYEPKVFSVGPYHRDNKKLQHMERLKLWYLESLLNRSRDPETTLEDYVREVRELEACARASYAEELNLSEDEFVAMMLVDGCFIIELFRRKAKLVPIDMNDPIFNMSWMIESLEHDLMILENQLPWIVLERLFDLTMVPTQGSSSLTGLALNFFKTMLPITVNQPSRFDSFHLLDLLWNALVSSHRDIEPEERSNRWPLIPCSVDLHEYGVKFKRGRAGNILDIKFRNGILEIPPLLIQSNTEAIFRNLIALEQCSHRRPDKITSYAFLLECLIKTQEDADFLSRRGIIENWMSDVEVTVIFKNLCNDAAALNFYFADLSQLVHAFTNDRFTAWRATLTHRYFRTPWAVLSVMAFTLIVLLTFTQTFFSILTYWKIVNLG